MVEKSLPLTTWAECAYIYIVYALGPGWKRQICFNPISVLVKSLAHVSSTLIDRNKFTAYNLVRVRVDIYCIRTRTRLEAANLFLDQSAFAIASRARVYQARLNLGSDQLEIAHVERTCPPASTHALKTLWDELFSGAQGKRALAHHPVPTRLPCARLNH